MIARREDAVIHLDLFADHLFAGAVRDFDFRRTLLAVRREAGWPRHFGVDAALFSGDGNDLLPIGTFGKHTQIEHTPRAVFELDRHKGVVDDVGLLAVIALVTVVHIRRRRGIDPHRIAFERQAHQIPEVTAFFDQRAAGANVESVPVAHLGQEREAVLADRHHARRSRRPVADLGKKALNRRHIAILHSHPDRSGPVLGFGQNLAAINRSRAQRLFTENGKRRFQNVHQDRMVRVVGGHDHKGIKIALGDHFLVVRVGFGRPARSLNRKGSHPLIRIGNGSNLAPPKKVDVADMLLPHHSRADEAIADCHVQISRSGRLRAPATPRSAGR